MSPHAWLYKGRCKHIHRLDFKNHIRLTKARCLTMDFILCSKLESIFLQWAPSECDLRWQLHLRCGNNNLKQFTGKGHRIFTVTQFSFFSMLRWYSVYYLVNEVLRWHEIMPNEKKRTFKDFFLFLRWSKQKTCQDVSIKQYTCTECCVALVVDKMQNVAKISPWTESTSHFLTPRIYPIVPFWVKSILSQSEIYHNW